MYGQKNAEDFGLWKCKRLDFKTISFKNILRMDLNSIFKFSETTWYEKIDSLIRPLDFIFAW